MRKKAKRQQELLEMQMQQLEELEMEGNVNQVFNLLLYYCVLHLCLSIKESK